MTSRFNACAATLLAVLVALSTIPANAQQPANPANAAINESDFQLVYERARARARAGDWAGALQDHRRAFELAGGQVDSIVAGNHGRAALEMGEYAEAATMIRYGLKRLHPGEPPEVRARFEQRLAEVEAKVGTVTLVVGPAGAEVVIDGKSHGRAPLAEPVYLAPGDRTVTAQLAGHHSESVTIQVTTGAKTTVTVTLQSPIATGQGTTIPPDGPTQNATDSMSPAVLGGGVSMVGLGVIGIAAAIVLGATAADRSASADMLEAQARAMAPAGNPCSEGSPIEGSSTCIALADNRRGALRFRGGAIGAGISGSVLLIAGAATLIAGNNNASAPVAITVTPTYAGLSFSGTF